MGRRVRFELVVTTRVSLQRIVARAVPGGFVDFPEPLVHDPCMAVKTITLDLEAYELLRRHKRGKESFSHVIKEHFRPKHTIRDLERALDGLVISDETLDAIDRQIEARQRDTARARAL
jgi:predicted CopG family antitoxin